jgi:hypothetical protein
VLRRTASKNKRLQILKKFPDYVVNDIIEILLNVVSGNIEISKHLQKSLRRQKRPLLQLMKDGKKANIKKRRSMVYKQNGGFLGAVIPVLASVISAIVSNA